MRAPRRHRGRRSSPCRARGCSNGMRSSAWRSSAAGREASSSCCGAVTRAPGPSPGNSSPGKSRRIRTRAPPPRRTSHSSSHDPRSSSASRGSDEPSEACAPCACPRCGPRSVPGGHVPARGRLCGAAGGGHAGARGGPGRVRRPGRDPRPRHAQAGPAPMGRLRNAAQAGPGRRELLRACRVVRGATRTGLPMARARRVPRVDAGRP